MKYVRNDILTIVSVIALLFSCLPSVSSQELQRNSDSINKQKLNTVIYTGAGLYTATLGVLYFGWYKDNALSSFHWYNDNKAWLQADKGGHLVSTYVMSNYAFWSLRWAGVNNNKAALYAGFMGWSALTVIEILDSFSADWGASSGDLIANTASAAFFTTQQVLWKEQRIRLKFSYHPTQLAKYRPDLLGETEMQRMLKDYNGQTFWISANIRSFIKNETKFPQWIDLSVGYGGTGMLGSFSNPTEWNGNELPHYNRTRHYYFSLDIDWTRINTNSSLLRFAFKALSFVKAPFPTIEYNKEDQFVFHWLFF
ncbi:MAG: DUF2279 domain-containing protein [Bacteroidetes bacterium]|nr:DUF2279 domain-containing protein [Bacteroidota bacterium]MBL6943643.1 DUF2279 domain-containing protein [Bacteroidales bacterium]